MRLAVALWTGQGAMPPALVRYRLMEKFGWTPEELRRQRWADISEILAVMSAESEANRAHGRVSRTRH